MQETSIPGKENAKNLSILIFQTRSNIGRPHAPRSKAAGAGRLSARCSEPTEHSPDGRRRRPRRDQPPQPCDRSAAGSGGVQARVCFVSQIVLSPFWHREPSDGALRGVGRSVWVALLRPRRLRVRRQPGHGYELRRHCTLILPARQIRPTHPLFPICRTPFPPIRPK